MFKKQILLVFQYLGNLVQYTKFEVLSNIVVRVRKTCSIKHVGGKKKKN